MWRAESCLQTTATATATATAWPAPTSRRSSRRRSRWILTRLNNYLANKSLTIHAAQVQLLFARRFATQLRVDASNGGLLREQPLDVVKSLAARVVSHAEVMLNRGVCHRNAVAVATAATDDGPHRQADGNITPRDQREVTRIRLATHAAAILADVLDHHECDLDARPCRCAHACRWQRSVHWPTDARASDIVRDRSAEVAADDVAPSPVVGAPTLQIAIANERYEAAHPAIAAAAYGLIKAAEETGATPAAAAHPARLRTDADAAASAVRLIAAGVSAGGVAGLRRILPSCRAGDGGMGTLYLALLEAALGCFDAIDELPPPAGCRVDINLNKGTGGVAGRCLRARRADGKARADWCGCDPHSRTRMRSAFRSSPRSPLLLLPIFRRDMFHVLHFP